MLHIWVIARARMRECFTGIKLAKASSYLSMAWASVSITAPLVGGHIQEYLGRRTNFIVLFIFGLFNLIIIFIFEGNK